MANNLGMDFDDTKCSNGDLLFKVPLNWLIYTINSNKSLISTECGFNKINTLSDFIVWSNIYTHTEGKYILEKALNDDILLNKPIIYHCNYCNSNNIFK